MRTLYRSLVLGVLLLASATGAAAQSLPLGSPLPMQDTSVQRVNGTSATIGSLLGAQGTVFVFWSNQCTWADKYRDRILALKDAYEGQGIAFVFVNANDANAFPQEAASEGAGQNLGAPYIVDAGAQFAQALGAERTPHIYVFDADAALVYVGTIDDSPGDPSNVQNTYLEDALSQVVQGAAIATPQTKAFGCMIRFPNP